MVLVALARFLSDMRDAWRGLSCASISSLGLCDLEPPTQAGTSSVHDGGCGCMLLSWILQYRRCNQRLSCGLWHLEWSAAFVNQVIISVSDASTVYYLSGARSPTLLSLSLDYKISIYWYYRIVPTIANFIYIVFRTVVYFYLLMIMLLNCQSFYSRQL